MESLLTHSLSNLVLDPQVTLLLNLCSVVIVATKLIPGLRVFSLIAQGVLMVVEFLRGLFIAKVHPKYVGYTNLDKETNG